MTETRKQTYFQPFDIEATVVELTLTHVTTHCISGLPSSRLLSSFKTNYQTGL